VPSSIASLCLSLIYIDIAYCPHSPVHRVFPGQVHGHVGREHKSHIYIRTQSHNWQSVADHEHTSRFAHFTVSEEASPRSLFIAGVYAALSGFWSRQDYDTEVVRFWSSRFCCKTRKSLLRLPPWVRSKPPGGISTGLRSQEHRDTFFLCFLLLCRHTASPPITSGMHTGGVQQYGRTEGPDLIERYSRNGPWKHECCFEVMYLYVGSGFWNWNLYYCCYC